MSSSTAIAWTQATWNPWMGCDKVSPGCAHCYAERDHIRYNRPPFNIVRRSKTTFDAPLRWKEPQLIFTCSWSDWFHEAADAWRPEAWEIIRRTPHHTYQVLTKRPERIREHLPDDWGAGWPHVWLGVSVENQRWAAERIPLLLETPAAVRFLSCEPLLGPVRLGWSLYDDPILGGNGRQACIDWVIVGGESGPDYRELNLEHLRSLVEQCSAAGVPVWVKQDSGLRSEMRGRIPDELWIQQRPEVTR